MEMQNPLLSFLQDVQSAQKVQDVEEGQEPADSGTDVVVLWEKRLPVSKRAKLEMAETESVISARPIFQKKDLKFCSWLTMFKSVGFNFFTMENTFPSEENKCLVGLYLPTHLVSDLKTFELVL